MTALPSSGRRLTTTALVWSFVGVQGAALLASWLLISVRGLPGVFFVAVVTATTFALAGATAVLGPRHVAPRPLAIAVLGSGSLSLTMAMSAVAVLGLDGDSAFTIGWAHPERAAWPHLLIGIAFMGVGMRLARGVDWIRSLQNRAGEPGRLRGPTGSSEDQSLRRRPPHAPR